MPRQTKQGLEYFPLDVVLDEEVKLIEAKFGIAGFGVLVKLWQIIYENGYFIMWTERELLLYKNRINVDINLLNDIINESFKWGLFDKFLYKNHHILTSSGIQKRYISATERRKEVIIEKAYWLIDIPDSGDVRKIIINEYIKPKNAYKNTQSKVKESIRTPSTTNPPISVNEGSARERKPIGDLPKPEAPLDLDESSMAEIRVIYDTYKSIKGREINDIDRANIQKAYLAVGFESCKYAFLETNTAAGGFNLFKTIINSMFDYFGKDRDELTIGDYRDWRADNKKMDFTPKPPKVDIFELPLSEVHP